MSQKQYGFFFDQTKCTGCNTCRVSCKDFYDLDLGVNFRRVYEYEGGNWTKQEDGWHQDVFSYYTSISCNHCASPACTAACPTGAMHKREEDGFVVVDQDTCVGCGYCSWACPYGAPQMDEKKKVMSKCHGCYERVAEGQKPICVESCPMRALDFGLLEDLQEKYGDMAGVAPLPSPDHTHPSLVIKPNKNARLSGDRTGNLQNSKDV